jgi:hypothetical protein
MHVKIRIFRTIHQIRQSFIETMAIITLTTDYGEKDYFASALKGAVLSQLPDTNIIDISHNVSPFNITEGAYILKNAYHHYPKGTIHIIGIDAEKGKDKLHIAAEIDGHFFIGADDGIFSLMFPEIKPDKVVALTIDQESDSLTFPGKDVFVKAACHIARGGMLGVIGRQLSTFKPATDFNPIVSTDGNSISGSVIYIDNFGNVVTNITKKLFRDIGKTRDFEIKLPRVYTINKIHKDYSSVPESEMLALFNSGGYLEIAVSRADSQTKSGASRLLGISFRDTIKVVFS